LTRLNSGVFGLWAGVGSEGERTQEWQTPPENRTKREFLAEWVRAVNEAGGFGRWAWDVSFHPRDIAEVLDRHGAGTGDARGSSWHAQ
jgi:hypothetical protein